MMEDTLNKALQAILFLLSPVWLCIFVLWMLVIAGVTLVSRSIQYAWGMSGEIINYWVGDGPTEAME